ncbi:MAG TPA: nucleoid occlusion protein [Clostridia bacterium]|jgi:ParB family chromosome partitioning protein|nr:nucleoid occlusion protein [Clostridia bacterium]
MREQLIKLLGLQEKDVDNSQIRQIPIDLIKVNPYQPRKHFNEDSLKELSDSIRTFGIIQPLLLRKQKNYYELIAGERRLRASKMAGLTTVPAIITNYTNQEMAELALVENLQREDLGFMDEAEGYRLLIDEFGLTQEELARRVGKSQSTIANKLRLLRLPENVRQNISQEIITERHARALLRLKNDKQQLEVLNKIYEQKLNVRQTEEVIESILRAETLPAVKKEKEKKNKKVVRFIRDVRILINTVRQLVNDMEKSGIPICIEEVDTGEQYQLVVSITKKKAVAE